MFGCRGDCLSAERGVQRGEVEVAGTSDNSTRVWRHFLGLVNVALFRTKCPAAGARYGYVIQTAIDIFDCASDGSQKVAQSITAVFN